MIEMDGMAFNVWLDVSKWKQELGDVTGCKEQKSVSGGTA